MVSAMIAITGTVSIAISLITPPPLHHHPKLHVRHGEHQVSFRYDAEHGSYIRIDRQFYPGLPLSRPKYPVPSRSLPGVSTYRSPLYPLYSSVSRSRSHFNFLLLWCFIIRCGGVEHIFEHLIGQCFSFRLAHVKSPPLCLHPTKTQISTPLRS